MSAEHAYNTSKGASEVLFGSLLGVTNLNYVAHKGCVHRASADGQKQVKLVEKTVILRQKELADGAGMNRLQRAAENGAWLTAIQHYLDSPELSWEEHQENLLLLYGIVPLKFPTHCNGCGKKFLVPHYLSCPKGGFVLVQHNDTTKD